MTQNPIPRPVRGYIYVASIVVSGLGLVATAVLPVIEGDAWMPVVGATVSAFGLVAAGLARDNLSTSHDEQLPNERGL